MMTWRDVYETVVKRQRFNCDERPIGRVSLPNELVQSSCSGDEWLRAKEKRRQHLKRETAREEERQSRRSERQPACMSREQVLSYLHQHRSHCPCLLDDTVVHEERARKLTLHHLVWANWWLDTYSHDLTNDLRKKHQLNRGEWRLFFTDRCSNSFKHNQQLLMVRVSMNFLDWHGDSYFRTNIYFDIWTVKAASTRAEVSV